MLHTLYYTPGSGNSFKPALVAHQLGRKLALRKLDVIRGETRSASFRAINPRGQVPYLMMPTGDGLPESNAIAWYLAAGSELAPTDPLEQARTIQWMLFEQTELGPPLSAARFHSRIVPDETPAMRAQIVRWRDAAGAALALLDAHLAESAFLAGARYGVADICVFGYVHLAEEAGVELIRFPGVRAWLGRVRASPRYAEIDVLLPE